jgi:DNA primase
MGIIDFITETTPMSKAEAFHWLMDDCDGSNPYHYNETPEPQSHLSLDVLVPFMSPPHPYLLDRGIPVDNIVKHVVGYDSATDCIVIPVFWQGDLVGWQTRPVDDADISESRPKYMCSAGMKRGRLLYNRDDWHRGWCTVVVESPLTVVAKSHMQFNFVATMGGPTRGQMELMKDIVEGEGSIILAYDNDPSGWNDTMQVGNFLGRDGVLVALNEVDLDEMTDADLYEVLEDPMPYQEWFELVYPAKVAAIKESA